MLHTVGECYWPPRPEPFDGAGALAEALAQPVYDELGHGFRDGLADVAGEVLWDVASRRVTIRHSYQDWVSEDEREV